MIKRHRLEAGISQSTLAARSGITRAYLCQLENGHRKNPSAAVLLKISQALQVSPHKLLTIKTPKKVEENVIYIEEKPLLLEGIIGEYDLLDYTDSTSAIIYPAAEVFQSRLTRWVVVLSVCDDGSVTLYYRDKAGNESAHDTRAIETKPTIFIDHYQLLYHKGLLHLFWDDGVLRFFKNDQLHWYLQL